MGDSLQLDSLNTVREHLLATGTCISLSYLSFSLSYQLIFYQSASASSYIKILTTLQQTF